MKHFFYTTLIVGALCSLSHCKTPDVAADTKALITEGEALLERMGKLDREKVRIEYLGRALTEKEIKFTERVTALQEDFYNWESEVYKLESPAGAGAKKWEKQIQPYRDRLKDLQDRTEALFRGFPFQ